MKNLEIENIIVKFINQEANNSELKKLESWLENDENKNVFNNFIKVEYLTSVNFANYNVEKAKQSIKNKKQLKKKLNFNAVIKKFSVAASIIFILGLSFLYFNNTNNLEKTANISNSIQIGTNKAILTLNNGDQIALGQGEVVKIKNASSDGDQIIYFKRKQNKEQIAYNYLTVPRGGQFKVVLSDKTEVWLNSESQLKFPVIFKKGETRTVELVYGEAYFDVSPSTYNDDTKFSVFNKSQEIEVLGTEFNIKAYENEDQVFTTLIEGKVSVNTEKFNKILKPKEQSILNKKNKNITISEVNIYNEISWKEGVFSFERKTLKEIMKVLTRWYDVEVIFENKLLEDVKFFGVLDKEQELEEILKTIKKFKIIENYEIKGKVILLK